METTTIQQPAVTFRPAPDLEISFNEDAGRWEAETPTLTAARRLALKAAGFRWDAQAQAFWTADDDVALAGMEVH